MSPSRKKRKINTEKGRLVKETVPLDQLAWREVPFPQKFEDAEGFFGLEEVSDVEVEKDVDSGRIGYKAKQKEGQKLSEAAAATKSGVLNGQENGSQPDEGDEDWGGFEEEAPIHTQKHPIEGIDNTKTKPRKSALKTGGLDSQPGNFELLDQINEDHVDVSQWMDLGVSDEITTSLARMKMSRPTPIQRSAIPAIMKGHDVIGKAVTGSGKTLAFGIPIVHAFLDHKKNISRDSNPLNLFALIISPTRELAHQLSAHMTEMCSSFDGPKIATFTGGLSLHKQQRLLQSADIMIGTPGRLWELISGTNGFQKRLHKTKFIVLDEADRLLSKGHYEEMTQILDAVELNEDSDSRLEQTENSIDRQILVFSATFRQDLFQKLAGGGGQEWDQKNEHSLDRLMSSLKFGNEKPLFIDVNPDHQMAEKLDERILECAALEKDDFLYALFLLHTKARVLVFANSIGAVRRLTTFLQTLNVLIHPLHSQMEQKARLRSIERFSSPAATSSILVATDVAARGLDIPSVDLIVHYHVPRAADMYVHRSGRTARAEQSGSSILLCAPNEVQGVRRLVLQVHNAHNKRGKQAAINAMHIERQIISRLKSRVLLSQKITEASLAKEKHNHEDKWLKEAAEDLGVDYDSDEFEATQGRQKGRGHGRQKREKAAREMSKDQLASLRAQLKQELKTRVNVGVSEKYLTAGGLDVDALLQEKEQGKFLGNVNAKTFVT